MKVLKLVFFSLSLGLAASAASACDGMAIDDEPASVSSALAKRDGKRRVPPPDETPDGYITASGGDRTTVFNDFAVEDEGPGILKDCSAHATECNASCSVVGQGDCEAGALSVTCSLIYPCGENMCSTEHTIQCGAD